MVADRTLYLCTCKDENCPGRTVIEYSLPLPANLNLSPEKPASSPCPLCGKEMKVVPMPCEITDFVPEPARPDAIRQTIWSRTSFQVPPETEGRTSSTDTKGREQNGQSDKDFLTERDVAKILGTSVTAVQRLVAEKKLGFVQLTKRKKVFTQELIDDFIRRESGLSVRQRTLNKSPLLPKPNQSGISIEESRKILRKVLKKP